MKSGLKLLLLLVAVLLAGGGIGAAVYVATRPQPVIHLTSRYMVGTMDAGSDQTTLTLSGQKFSGNSTITILLDGAPAPGSSPVHSDSSGAISVTLTVTSDWAVGAHTVTARDAAGYLTKAGAQVMIVVPGEAQTPGPNGAPSDDASGRITVHLQSGGESLTLLVRSAQGKPSVCGQQDDGKPHTHTERASGLTFTETIIATCRGGYKGGKLTYTRTATSDIIQCSNGVRCSAQVPYIAVQLDGTFSSPTEVAGTASHDAVAVNCDHGLGRLTLNAETSTWSGNWTAAS
jgi:hypothetical protein